MAKDSQTPQESSNKERSKSTPLQGTDYARKSSWVDPKPKYNNLEEWQKDNSQPEVHSETENVKVVRTFYTFRPTPRSDVKIWYADKEFGFYEGLPKRVADLSATHVNIEFPRISGINPKVELSVQVRDKSTGKQRPIHMHEFIDAVIHDDDEWKARLPKVLTEWQLIFPKGESYGVMRITGYPDSPGPSRHSP